ncbi:hypothetical protein MXB_4569 [Myxobolus squamalis]|nr:hypothetical protein MXB_4569 [Myxobolus squamalis]
MEGFKNIHISKICMISWVFIVLGVACLLTGIIMIIVLQVREVDQVSHAFEINMAHRYIDKTIFSLKRRKPFPSPFNYVKPIKYKETTAEIQQKPTRYEIPGSTLTFIGEIPKPFYLWKNFNNTFPSFEDSKVDIKTYLEQKDVFNRIKLLDIKEFCQGSIIKMSWIDNQSKSGINSFLGAVVHKSHWDNRIGAAVTLRNVIDDELLEMALPIYGSNIIELTVIRHSYLTNEQIKLLKELPAAFSHVSDRTKIEPYNSEPKIVNHHRDKISEIHRILIEKLDAINIPIGKKKRNRALNAKDDSLFTSNKILWPVFRRLTKKEIEEIKVVSRYKKIKN